MRMAIVFLLALGLGTLAVRGQERDGASLDLLRRIDALVEELQERADRDEGDGRRQPLEMQIYDVRDLVAWTRDQAMRESNLVPSKYQYPQWDIEYEPQGFVELDWLIEMIRVFCDPASWDVIEGAEIQPKNSRLFVRTVPSVHARIVELLAHLRAYVAPRFAAEFVAVPAGAALRAGLSGTARDLDEATARELLGGPRVATWSATGLDGQQVVVRSGRERRYLQDYEVEIAQSAEIGDPIPHHVFDGAQGEVRCTLDRTRDGAVLFARLEKTVFGEPLRRVQTMHGPIELPRLDLVRLRTGCWVPLDTPVLLGFAGGGDGGVAILATVRRVGG